jgi:hypothetical protein
MARGTWLPESLDMLAAVHSNMKTVSVISVLIKGPPPVDLLFWS